MMALTRLARRAPLVPFLGLAYLLSWLPQLFGGGLFPFGPLLAALAVTALADGPAEVRTRGYTSRAGAPGRTGMHSLSGSRSR